MGTTRKENKALTVVLSVSGFVLVFLIWHFGVAYTSVGLVLPSPLEVFSRLGKGLVQPIGRYTLVQHTLFSLRRVGIGFCLSAAAGILLGVLMGRSRIAAAIARPIFEMVRPIPGVAWIPMAILWFGIGETAKIFIIFMGGFAHLVVNTFSGARRVDDLLIGVASMLGAGKRQIFFNVVMPSCVPYIFAGLQVALSTSWMAVLAAEMVSSTEGAGWIIVAAQETGDTTQIFVGIIAIAVVGFLLAVAMRLLEKILCAWRVAE